MKSFKQYFSEASFKVNIPDMPPVYVDAKSAGEVKKKLRALLKKPMDVEVDRVPPSDVKKAFRLRAQGKDEDEVQEEAELGEARKKKDNWLIPFDIERSGRKYIAKSGNYMVHIVPSGRSDWQAVADWDPVIKGRPQNLKDAEKAAKYMLVKKIANKNWNGPVPSALGFNEEVELDEGRLPKYGSSVKYSTVMKKIKDGTWEASTDVKPRRSLEIRDTESNKKTMIQVEEVELDERRGRPRNDGTSSGDLENIQMQLRKSITMRGQKDVEFADGKKVKVPERVARQVLAGIDKMRQPKDKQIVVNYIMKSQKNLMDYAAGKVKMNDMDPEAIRNKLLGRK